MPQNEVVLQFSSSTAWQSALIRKLCHSPFSHIDLVLSDGNLLGASDQGLHSPCIAGNPQGVAIRPPDYQAFHIRRNAIIKTNKAERIEELARSQLGKAFDASAITAFLSDNPFDRDWRLDEHWFCAEMYAWAFELAPYWSVPLLWPKNRISPTDFLMLFTVDPNFINRDEFWHPLQGLKLGAKEQ